MPSTKIPPELEKLTQKQRDFVLAYVVEKNGAKAAKVAGYKGTPGTLKTMANKLVTNGDVKKAIDALTLPAVKKAIVNIETVIGELADIGYADWKHFIKVGQYNVDLKLSEKIAALKLLGDHVGAFSKAPQEEGGTHLHLHGNVTADEARDVLRSILKK